MWLASARDSGDDCYHEVVDTAAQALHFVEAVVVWATSGESCGTEVGVYDGRVGGGS